MKKQATILTASAIAITLVACGPSKNFNEKELTGNWIEIMPVNQQIRQGVTLKEKGEAESIGMATLKYEKWQLLPDGHIVLDGKSIGNHQTLDFSDTLAIISLSNNTLTLGKGGAYRIQYVKQSGDKELSGGDDAATGYTWSDVRQEKIRIFEVGEKVLSATDPEATSAGFLVFQADSARVELFLPEQKTVLDRRQRPDGTPVWNVEDDDTYLVERNEGQWLVSRRGRLLYLTDGTKNRIEATFQTDKDSEVNVTFYTQAGIAQLLVDGTYSLLKQYRTASGYGYKNPIYDLRGKGQEATLTNLMDGKKTQLKEK